MSDNLAQITDNLESVRARIAAAAQSAGRQPDEVQLVAVTKYVDAETTALLMEAGCAILGESRPQQLWQKAEYPALNKAHWHLIGHLQRNKVKRTLPFVDLIHSVDSLRLLSEINDAANVLNKQQNVLLEINTSGEAAKHGLRADELRSVLEQLSEYPNEYPNIEVCGLMTMAARQGGAAVAAQNFASLRELRDRVRADCPAEITLHELSMGMSQDFEAAIREGATLVRIGSSLFEGLR